MNRILKAVVFASLCFSLMLPVNSFASQGGNGGGGSNGGDGGDGGKSAQSRLLLTASSVATPDGRFPAVADTATVITVTAENHEGDAPKITMRRQLRRGVHGMRCLRIGSSVTKWDICASLHVTGNGNCAGKLAGSAGCPLWQ